MWWGFLPKASRHVAILREAVAWLRSNRFATSFIVTGAGISKKNQFDEN